MKKLYASLALFFMSVSLLCFGIALIILLPSSAVAEFIGGGNGSCDAQAGPCETTESDICSSTSSGQDCDNQPGVCTCLTTRVWGCLCLTNLPT